MAGRRSETVRNKSRRKKLKKKFLLTSKKCWLIEQTLLPLYQHLIDGYSEKLRDEWRVKVKEELDIEAAPLQVKEEPQDDLLESFPDRQSSSNNNPQVTYHLFPLSYLNNYHRN